MLKQSPKGNLDMRQCKCGGLVRQYELTGNREVWTCDSCKRYEIIKRGNECLKISGSLGLAMLERAVKPNAEPSGIS